MRASPFSLSHTGVRICVHPRCSGTLRDKRNLRKRSPFVIILFQVDRDFENPISSGSTSCSHLATRAHARAGA